MNMLRHLFQLCGTLEPALGAPLRTEVGPRRLLAVTLAGLGMLLSMITAAAEAGVAACTPEVSVTEQIVDEPGGGILAQYVMTTGHLCGMQIVAFAVDNNGSISAYSNLPGWNALVVTDNFWDAGIVLSRDDFGAGSSYRFTTGPAGIGSFVSFFRPYAALANLYWLSAHYGGPVIDNSTAFTTVGEPMPLPTDAFQFETRALASTPIAFLYDPSGGGIVAVQAVPEPAAMWLFAIGLLGLLGRLRLRRA